LVLLPLIGISFFWTWAACLRWRAGGARSGEAVLARLCGLSRSPHGFTRRVPFLRARLGNRLSPCHTSHAHLRMFPPFRSSLSRPKEKPPCPVGILRDFYKTDVPREAPLRSPFLFSLRPTLPGCSTLQGPRRGRIISYLYLRSEHLDFPDSSFLVPFLFAVILYFARATQAFPPVSVWG